MKNESEIVGYVVPERFQDLGPEGGSSLCALSLGCKGRAVSGRASAYGGRHRSGLGCVHVVGAHIRAAVFLPGTGVCSLTSFTSRVCLMALGGTGPSPRVLAEQV